MPNISDPGTEEERLRSDIAEQQFVDFRTGLVRICYDPNFVSYILLLQLYTIAIVYYLSFQLYYLLFYFV